MCQARTRRVDRGSAGASPSPHTHPETALSDATPAAVIFGAGHFSRRSFLVAAIFDRVNWIGQDTVRQGICVTEGGTAMALRHNHYDAAFEEYLRDRRVPYVAVDEQRRSLLESASLKSMDFIVHAPDDNLLVDVKGRKFPAAGNGGRWENWVTADDIASLLRWEEVFGPGYQAVLVFAYDVDAARRDEFETLFTWRSRAYAFFAVSVGDYRAAMTARSARWDTYTVARRRFADLRFPFDALLASAPQFPASVPACEPASA